MKTHYFLFGGEASAIMGSTGNIHDAVRVGCNTFVFKDGQDPTDLLAAYTGWNDFWVLTEEEYNQINELIEQR
jgi:hypothetical protein